MKIVLSVSSIIIAINLFIAFFQNKLLQNFHRIFEEKNYRAVQEAIPIRVVEAKHN